MADKEHPYEKRGYTTDQNDTRWKKFKRNLSVNPWPYIGRGVYAVIPLVLLYHGYKAYDPVNRFKEWKHNREVAADDASLKEKSDQALEVKGRFVGIDTANGQIKLQGIDQNGKDVYVTAEMLGSDGMTCDYDLYAAEETDQRVRQNLEETEIRIQNKTETDQEQVTCGHVYENQNAMIFEMNKDMMSVEDKVKVEALFGHNKAIYIKQADITHKKPPLWDNRGFNL